MRTPRIGQDRGPCDQSSRGSNGGPKSGGQALARPINEGPGEIELIHVRTAAAGTPNFELRPRLLGNGDCPHLSPVPGGDRVTPVAPERAAAHAHAGRGLSTLVFVTFDEIQHAHDRWTIEAARA